MQKRCNGAKRNGIFSNLQLARTCSGKCLQQICQYCAFQRNATTSNCPLNAKSHPAGMRICYAIFAGISLRLCSISLRSFRITFAAYLPTHIKSLRDFFQSLLNNYRNNLYIISFFLYIIGIILIPQKIHRQERKQKQRQPSEMPVAANFIFGGILHIFCTNWCFFTKNHYICKSKIINFIKILKP